MLLNPNNNTQSLSEVEDVDTSFFGTNYYETSGFTCSERILRNIEGYLEYNCFPKIVSYFSDILEEKYVSSMQHETLVTISFVRCIVTLA